MFITRLLIIGGLLALHAGCASLNKEECQLANWRALGYEQGSNGRAISQFNHYQKDCAKHQIKADFNDYKVGYEEGLQAYCTFEQGLRLGKGGNNYNVRCPSRRFAQFDEGYQAGLNRFCSYENGYSNGAEGKHSNNNCDTQTYPEYDQGFLAGTVKHELGQLVVQLEDDLAHINQSMTDISQKIKATEELLVGKGHSVLERKQALSDLKLYKRQLHELDDAYHAKEAELVNAQTEYQRL